MQDNNFVNNISDEAIDRFISSGGTDGVNLETGQEIPDKTIEQNDTEVMSNLETTDQKQQDLQNQEIEERNYKAAMLEERDRRKELQRRLQEQEERSKQAETQLQKIIEEINRNTQIGPSFEEAPLEALRHEQNLLKRELELERQQVQYLAEQQKQTAFVENYKNYAASFAKSNPDFGDAYNNLLQNRYQELTVIGYSPQEAKNLLFQEEAMIVSKAYQDGVNPAERMYQLAKQRGHSNKPVEQKSNQPTMEQIAKTKNAGMSLSNTSGGASKGPDLSIEALLAMDDADFDANWDKVIKKLK